MKVLPLFGFLFFLHLTASAQSPGPDSLNMIRLAHWDDQSLPIAPQYSIQYSGCWGLTVNGREIAVVGGALHTLFFDVTEPTQPVLIGKFAGQTATGWREYKSYQNRIYGVSDATQEGLQIFDLSQAPDTIVRTYFSNEFFNNAHTITLDTTSGRIYLNGSGAAIFGILVLDVSANPDQPTLLKAVQLPGSYVHDSYVRNDTIYASHGNNGYYVYDFTDLNNVTTLGFTTTGGYNHNSWVNAEGTHAYYTEEIPAGRPVQIVDLADLGVNTTLENVGSFLDTFSVIQPGSQWKPIPHNVYIKDHLLFNSQYEDGLTVYDITNPVEPVLVGHYDTHPENTVYNGYRGNWGNYPWLPSGNIIAADMQTGLSVLKLTITTPVKQPATSLEARVFPNPAHDRITVRLAETAQYRLFNATGQLLRTGTAQAGDTPVTLAGLVPGVYCLQLTGENGAVAQRKIVVR